MKSEQISLTTVGQSSNSNWFKHRIGRITGSVAHRVLTRGAYHLSELTGLEELVLIGVNGNRKTSSRVYARGNCAMRHADKGKQTWRCRYILMSSVLGSCCGALKPM